MLPSSPSQDEYQVTLIDGQPCAKKKMNSDSKRKQGHRRRKICNSADSIAGIEQDDNDSYSAVEVLNGSSLALVDEGLVEDSAGATTLQSQGRVHQKSVPRSTEEQAQLLVELIAREMAAALLRQKSGSSLLSGSRSSSDSAEDSSTRSSSAVEAIAELVVSSMKDGQVKAGGDLERTVQMLLKQRQSREAVQGSRKSAQMDKEDSQDARSVPDGTLDTEISGSNSDLLPAEPDAAPGAEDLNGSSSDEIVWMPEAVDPANHCSGKEKREIPLFPLATTSKTKYQKEATEKFEPRLWTASDFGSKKRVNSDPTPPVMIDPDEEIESDDYDAEELNLDAEEDNVSVMSDITGLTGAFDDATKAKQKAAEVEVKEEKKGKAEFSLSDSDSFKAFAGNTRTLLNNTTYGTFSVRNLTIKKKAAKKGTGYPPKPKSNVSVSFTHVQVRHYERIMSDNPASAAGPSIGIGWRFLEADPVCVDTFEKRERRSRAQSLTELQLSKATRLTLVRALGYTDREIAANVRDLNKSRSNRKQTVDNLGVEKVEEAMEKVKRKVRRIFSLQRQPSLSSLDSSKTPSVEIDQVSV
jgi:hypothetical protein